MMVKPRVPEGGAIEDDVGMTMEEYSVSMKNKMGFEYKNFVKHIIDMINPPKGVKVLEIGPGPDWIGIWLLKERPDLELTGLEASKDMIRVATNNAKSEGINGQIKYINCFVENMQELKDNQYDLVISNDSLHHWEDPVKAFKEINRVLKKNGQVFIKDERRDLGIRGKIILHLFGRIFAGKNWKYWKSSVDASYTPEEIQSFLKESNIEGWAIKTTFMDLSIEST